jgi:sulfoxide reductase heme-binding subunit YedZ
MARYLGLLKSGIFLLCLLPLAFYLQRLYVDELGANPIEALTRGLGTWALNFLLITLLVTPLRRFSGWNWLIRLRRMLGLYCFFYALLHLGTYLWLDQFFDWMAIAKDIFKRPFITVGMLTFVLLLPLAITSNSFALRRLGGRRWQKLHRAIYAIGLLALLHYSWMVKADIAGPLWYAAALAVVLGLRVYWRFKDSRQPRHDSGQNSRLRSPSGRRVIPLVVRK